MLWSSISNHASKNISTDDLINCEKNVTERRRQHENALLSFLPIDIFGILTMEQSVKDCNEVRSNDDNMKGGGGQIAEWSKRLLQS